MGSGKQHIRWVALGLCILLCLVLVALEFSIPHTPLHASLPMAGAQSARVRIMPLGDSITYGSGSSTEGGYRLPLWNELSAYGSPIDFVGSQQTGPTRFDPDNEGHPGWKINQIAAKVVDWLLTYRPQIILLHIGTNDYFKDDNPAQAPARLSHLIDLITTTLPNATVIVAQIIPLARNAKLNAEVVAYNATIPTMVQTKVARGKHVQYVDMYHAVSPSMLPDQIHPDDAGYARMAKVWLRALFPLLHLTNRSTPTAGH